LSKPWPIGITSLAVVVKEKSLFDSAAPEKKEDAISFLQKLELAIAISHMKLIIPN
jgi:hypothetical protein